MLITSGEKRKLDLKMIYGVIVFVAQPSERIVFYLDYIQVTR